MEQKLKVLPAEPKKGKIFEMYGKQYSAETIRVNLNGIIEDFKKLSKEKSPTREIVITSREVPRPVWIEWIKTFGFPVNYEQREDWLNEKTVFDNV